QASISDKRSSPAKVNPLSEVSSPPRMEVRKLLRRPGKFVTFWWNRFTRAATLSVMSCARLALSPLLMLLFAACASAPDPAATPTVQGPLLGRPCPMPSEQGEGDGAQHPTR